jgi:hypothetical protein
MSEPTPWDESVCNREIHAEIGGWPPTGGQNPTRQARHNAETGVTPLKAMFENQLMRVSSLLSDRVRSLCASLPSSAYSSIERISFY